MCKLKEVLYFKYLQDIILKYFESSMRFKASVVPGENGNVRMTTAQFSEKDYHVILQREVALLVLPVKLFEQD